MVKSGERDTVNPTPSLSSSRAIWRTPKTLKRPTPWVVLGNDRLRTQGALKTQGALLSLGLESCRFALTLGCSRSSCPSKPWQGHHRETLLPISGALAALQSAGLPSYRMEESYSSEREKSLATPSSCLKAGHSEQTSLRAW